MSAEARPAAETPGPTSPAPAAGARAPGDTKARRPRTFATRAVSVLFVAWLALSGALCYLIATELPHKPADLGAVAGVLAALGAVLAATVIVERRATDRRLASELGVAERTLRALEAVTDPGLAFLPVDEALDALLHRTAQGVGGDLVALLLTDEEGSALRVHAVCGATELRPVGSSVPMGEGAVGSAALWARPVVVPDGDRALAAPGGGPVAPGGGPAGPAGDLSAPAGGPAAPAGGPAAPAGDRVLAAGAPHGVASTMAAPLVVNGAVIGVVEVCAMKRRTFEDTELRVLQVAADRCAAMTERARLDGLARRNRYGVDHATMHLRVLAQGGTVLGEALDSYEPALVALGEVVVPEFADWFAIHVADDNGKLHRVVAKTRPPCSGGHLFRRAGHPHPEGDRVLRQAIAEGRAHVMLPTRRVDADALGAVLHAPDDLGSDPDVTSMMVIPIRARGAVGALSFVTGPGRRGYRPSDFETARDLAERVGATIERVTSWRASKRAGELAVRYAERLRHLVDAALVVNAELANDDLLRLLVEHAHRLLGADSVVVTAAPADGPVEEAVPVVEVAWPDGARTEDAGDPRAADGAGAGPVADDDLRGIVVAAADAVAREGGVVRHPVDWTSKGAGDASSAVRAAAVAALRVRGWLAAPIEDPAGASRRVVVAVGAPGTQFSDEDELVMALLAQMASVACENSRLYAEVVANEERLETLVEASPLAIAELGSDGEAQWWNRAAATLFGWRKGAGPRRIPAREASELVLAGILESAFRGGSIVGVRLFAQGANGERLELSVSASPLRQGQAVHGALVVAEDVTESQRILEQVHQAERLGAMTRMAGAVAHDFNNLLTVILGSSDVLMRRLGENHELGQDVAAIQRAGTRAAALTSQLVRIGGQQVPSQPEAVDVDGLVSGIEPMVTGVLGGGMRLEVEAGAGHAHVLVDRAELERSVLNLAINAKDAMPDGGLLTIRTVLVPPAGEGGGAQVELSVTDTGTGMDEETAAHCFEPFFTTKGRARGTGLGLAAVHALMTQAGGSVRLQTSPGRGSTFTLTLPVTAVRPHHEVPAAVPRAGSHDGARARGEVLLVVDDEPEVLRLEVRALTETGYEVAGAANASEALHVLNAMSGKVDLLVTDVVMPGMTGVELAAAVRWRYPAVDVLFVSGHPDDDGVVHDPLPEHAALLAKPFGPEDLILRVREILDRRPSRTAAAPDATDAAQAAADAAHAATDAAQAATHAAQAATDAAQAATDAATDTATDAAEAPAGARASTT